MTDDRFLSDDDITPESYADLAALAKTLREEDTRLDEPPVDLWSRIEAGITVADVPGGSREREPRRPRDHRGRSDACGHRPRHGAGAATPSVQDHRHRRRHRRDRRRRCVRHRHEPR
jgi:hypothetical protein